MQSNNFLYRWISLPKATGTTLLELLSCVLIAALLTIVLFSFYSTSQQFFRKIIAQFSLENDLLIASTLLTHAVQQAGYAGCRSLSVYANTLKASEREACQIYSGADLSDELKASTIKPDDDSDGLVVQYLSEHAVALAAPMQNDNELPITTSPLVKTATRYWISDCNSGEFFTIPAERPGVIITVKPLHKRYQQGFLGPWRKNWFFIGVTKRKSADGLRILGLYVEDENRVLHEIVESIIAMKMHWQDNTRLLAIELLARSTLRVSATPQSLWFAGKKMILTDGHYYLTRRVLVALRNQEDKVPHE